jgi:hypothetical protein
MKKVFKKRIVYIAKYFAEIIACILILILPIKMGIYYIEEFVADIALMAPVISFILLYFAMFASSTLAVYHFLPKNHFRPLYIIATLLITCFLVYILVLLSASLVAQYPSCSIIYYIILALGPIPITEFYSDFLKKYLKNIY